MSSFGGAAAKPKEKMGGPAGQFDVFG
jgi:hypothetical protein